MNDSEVASLEYFKSSKGYFGDRVELDWEVGQRIGLVGRVLCAAA